MVFRITGSTISLFYVIGNKYVGIMFGGVFPQEEFSAVPNTGWLKFWINKSKIFDQEIDKIKGVIPGQITSVILAS